MPLGAGYSVQSAARYGRRGESVSAAMYAWCMPAREVLSAAEMELLSPDERARMIREGMLDSTDGLDLKFRERVEAKSRRLAEEHGLLNTETS